MGCIGSTAKANDKGGANGVSNPDSSDEMLRKNGEKFNLQSVISSGPLSVKQYESRLQSETTKTIDVPMDNGGYYQVKYAAVSQRGYYPEALTKANQDSYCIHNNIGGSGAHLFGVFDGHGEFGTPCSQFARDKIPENLLKDNRAKAAVGGPLNQSYHRSFVETNNSLHRAQVDDTMSGTTAITVHLKGDKLVVANVGDSRATCGELNERGKVTAVDLSQDQTPFRADECVRVKRAGARVLTLDQLEGIKDPEVQCWGNEEDDDGDPPRLWVKNGMYPGTAFTRSIGDSAAERSCGVFAEPEMHIKTVNENTKYAVIASDGVFEFLPSQAVVEMVDKFDDPHEACIAIVAESYRLWLQYETRTDDITIIVMMFQNFPKSGAPAPAKGTRPSLVQPSMLPTQAPSRPVRRVMSKAKRASIEADLVEQEEEDVWEPPKNIKKKTSQEYASIGQAVKANFLFSHLTEEKRTLLFDLMEERTVKQDEVIIRQGDKGDYFYIVKSGSFDVFVKPADDKSTGLGQKVHTYKVQGTTHPAFGELALMYNKPRAANVRACQPGVLWALDRRAFKSVLHRSDSQTLIKVLRSVEVLQSLNSGQIQRLSDVLSEASYEKGQYILRQGDNGDHFYIIQDGEVKCTVRKDPNNMNEAPREVLRLGPHQYFGERALLSNSKRAANVVAESAKVRVLFINRQAFEEVLGPLQHIINMDRKWRERCAMQKEAVARRPSVAVLKALNPLDITIKDVLYTTDCTQLVVGQHSTRNEVMTLKMTSLSLATRKGRQAIVARERGLTKNTISPSPFIPASLKSQADKLWATVVLHTHPVITLDALVAEASLSEESTQFYGACILLTIEGLHMENCVYRGINPETLLLDEDGHLQITDFRFTKLLEGKTYTLCGNPEYLAPEIVEGTGHSAAVDFWALGVLLFWMLAGYTPFAGERDDELQVYRRITDRKLQFPSHFSANARDLIDALLASDPNQRIGYRAGGTEAVKDHPFFANVDWSALTSTMIDEVPVPAEIKERMANYQPVGLEQLPKPEPYDGPTDWLEHF
mmetsp:Transcript_4816/g.16791  ORF Transcript_4816/g.16791 Transcript_4816/m.16791 type:complete len:1045 (+) Transcript_4816:248-3382(+)